MPQNSSRQSSKSRPNRDRDTQRDHQQIADDNQQSGAVDTEEILDRAPELEQADGSDEIESEEDERA